jgi:hypothetical protein
MRALAAVALVLLGLAAVGAGAAEPAAKPSFAGKWSGTYALSFHNYGCNALGCLPDSPAYCGPGMPNPCPEGQTPRGTCPDFTLKGQASVSVTQAGSRVSGTITLVDGTFNTGPHCTLAGRSTTRVKFSGTAKGAVVTTAVWKSAGKLTLSGKSLTGTFSGQYQELVQTLTLRLKAS